MKKLIISLLSLAVLATSGVIHAYSFVEWDDEVLCMWIKQRPDNAGYLTEAANRNLSCDGLVTSSVVTTTTTTTPGKLKADRGDWIKSDGLPMWSAHHVKWELVFTARSKSYTAGPYAMADFDGDGVDDLFVITNPKQPGVDWSTPGPNCKTELGECFSKTGSISVFKVEQTPTKKRDGVYTSAMYQAIDVTGLLFSDNPIEMNGTGSTELHVADFNGDGKVDIFATDTAQIDDNWGGKNDVYFLSNKDTQGWTESTATHVTGTNVQKGKGFSTFSHGSAIGDIDNDGDIDIIVTSIVWTGGNGANQNGEIWCYVNQGDGHMVVRRCGNQWGFSGALGDIDNDGDLDLVWGSRTFVNAKEMNLLDRVPGCFSGRTSCNGTFNGVLLNDGRGNFNQRGASFPDDVRDSNGNSYAGVPSISVADLDGDGDLDVVRTHVGDMYAGGGMTIEENIGNGKFRTVFQSDFCAGPETKANWPTQEGNEYNCWVSEFKFGDFNKDGFIDIVLDGHDANISATVKDGAVYMSTGKFTYDIVLPSPLAYNGTKKAQEGFPLITMKLKKLGKTFGTEKVTKTQTQQEVEDEIAAFEAELDAMIVK